MAELQRHCQTHPDRRAIGVCVMTGEAICAECSTRYEGVNYSRRGLEMLHAQRAREQERAGAGERAVRIVALGLSPLMVLALYAFFRTALALLIDIGQRGAV